MNITKKDAEYVARLARLELSDDEKEMFAGQLGSILSYADQLNKLDTSNVPPTSHVLELANVTRKDEAVCSPEDLRERLLSNAPDREENYFKVKKVIE
ncbi:MAG: asparaginyl/glutamyl-tRNA amidotransferase subunit C [Elusimicrobia bacterium RIFOXYB2_FULL_50_12]|nr:MAG: asparaginyl/glutamyl-tRNA amidotransferase subunit C [Elusimicrobia bacterium RIFOXYB2_FULL_50_12]